MNIIRLAQGFKTVITWINQKMGRLSGFLIFAMMLFVTYDVFGRYLFNSPVKGSNAINELAMAPIAFFVMGFTQVQKRHVRVTLLYSSLSKRMQQILDSILYFIAAVAYGLISWSMGNRALGIALAPEKGPMDMVLGIPHVPFLFMVSFGCLLFCLQLLIDAVKAATKGKSFSDAA